MQKYEVMVVGGGAAGMMAAISARMHGARVAILERNPRVGKKILATGNGRCNFTNIYTDAEHYHGKNPKFIYGALFQFDVSKTIAFFEKLGIAHKVEDGGRVFPMSDQASSVLDVLLYELNRLGVEICCNCFVKKMRKTDNCFVLETEDGKHFCGQKVILACGGKAMPSTGSDGSGYELSRQMGHRITDIFPALVQLKLEGKFFKQIEGVKIIGTAEVLSSNKSMAKDSGDILFANYGVSGPPILQVSRKAGELLQEGKEAVLKVTVINNFSHKELVELLSRRFKNMPEKTVEFSLVGLVNKRLIRVLLKEAGIKDLNAPVSALSSSDVQKIARILTDWRFRISGTRSWPSAQVTAGGVDTADIDPRTMESRLVKGLFFAGEIMDIDGECGGFNLQWAWSSGFTAGKYAAVR
ncbi:MAG TPA: NAD(P)/FAD-dependent oxidoreductase [Thermoanaerobacterales bacterium]|nr:NAD(P)/FAD-dependent oxidoreductase [Thermoanaerobacterales bacterium]